MNNELYEGRCDGVLRKTTRNRAGEVDPATLRVRTNLHPDYGYGYLAEVPIHLTGEEDIPR